MRRPTLTRKRIEGLFFALSFAQSDIECMTESDQKEYKKEIDAFNSAGLYVAELNRWLKWKQEQEGNKESEKERLDCIHEKRMLCGETDGREEDEQC